MMLSTTTPKWLLVKHMAGSPGIRLYVISNLCTITKLFGNKFQGPWGGPCVFIQSLFSHGALFVLQMCPLAKCNTGLQLLAQYTQVYYVALKQVNWALQLLRGNI